MMESGPHRPFHRQRYWKFSDSSELEELRGQGPPGWVTLISSCKV
jgi:hypothetical protein